MQSRGITGIAIAANNILLRISPGKGNMPIAALKQEISRLISDLKVVRRDGRNIQITGTGNFLGINIGSAYQ